MKNTSTIRRARRAREKAKRSDRPRLSVFRSNRYTYGQVIDDAKGVTLASANTRESLPKGKPAKSGKDGKGKLDVAYEMGKRLAERARSANVTEVAFDKGPYRYHGRVRKVAEGAREGGLKF